MKYNAPFGNSNEDAAYVNGNPETGVMGSIPPAASIEYPQREIVNYVGVSGITPTNSDLLQLAKAVQTGKVNYGLDGGEPNKIYVSPVVPVSAYTVGLRLIIKVSYGNTGQVTINVNGLGQVPLIHCDLSPLLAYELLAGQMIDVAYDGANFQAIGGVTGGAVLMTEPQDLYVNSITGDDTLYDGTAPVVGGEHGGPFRTIEKALAQMVKYNLGGWMFSIHVADGTYTTTGWHGIEIPQPNGSGIVRLVGNITNPRAVSIFNIATGAAMIAQFPGYYICEGLSFRATAGNAGDAGNGFSCYSTSCALSDCNFDTIAPYGAQIYCVGGSVSVYGPTTISGSGGDHWMAGLGGTILTSSWPPPPMTILNGVTFNQFVHANTNGQCRLGYNTITGAGLVTGRKYTASGNGVISSEGRGTSYLPGTIAGVLASGGQYV